MPNTAVTHTGKAVTIADQPLASVSPAWSLSAGESSGSQPLEPHWIAAASADPQSPSCWTAPVHSDVVNIPNGQSQLLSHIRLSDEDYLLSQLSQLLLCLS